VRKFDKIARKKLGELLVDAGLISYEVVDHAISEQKRTGRLIGEILVEQGHVRELDIAVVLARQFQLPYLQLADYQFSKEIVELIPAELCHQYGLIPLDCFGDVMIVAVSQNPTRDAIDSIKEATGCTISPFVAVGSEVQRYLDELAPYDAKASLRQRRQAEAEEASGSTWTDVFDRGDSSATQRIAKATPAASADDGDETGEQTVRKKGEKKKPVAETNADASASALAIFDIGEERVTQRLKKPKK
jgi:type IV pilus assembly protein PilB